MVCDGALPPENVGGIVNYVRRVSTFLASENHDVQVFVPMRNAHPTDYDFSVRSVKPFGQLWKHPLLGFSTYMVVYRRLLKALDHEIRTTRGFDVIHAHNPFMSGRAVSELISRKRIPAVLHYHFNRTMDDYARNRRFSPAEQICKAGTRGYSRFIVNSNFMRKALSYRLRIPLETIDVLPLFAEARMLRPSDDGQVIRNKYAIPEEACVVLFVGRLVRVKRVDLLLAAIRQIIRKGEDVYLLVVGTGPSERDLHAYVAEARISNRVFFAGRVADDDLSRYYYASDIFANPALDECYGFTMLDAWSYGKAVVGTDHPVMQEIAEDGVDAMLSIRGRQDSLEFAIYELVRDPKLRNSLGMNGKKKAERDFSVRTYVRSLMKIYQTAIAEGPPRAE